MATQSTATSENENNSARLEDDILEEEEDVALTSEQIRAHVSSLSAVGMGESRKKQICLMLNHLDDFFLTNSPQLSIRSFTLDHIKERLLQKWSMYLCKMAKRRDKPEQLLSLQTAQNYFSAFRAYVLCRFVKDVELPHCLKPEKWASYLCDIVVSRRTDAAGQGQALRRVYRRRRRCPSHGQQQVCDMV